MVILSDIQGIEDFLGDMDFKVCGTPNGITALQMDNKAKGLSVEILARALKQAHEGRAFILAAMLETIDGPRAEMKETAPRIETIKIPVDKIRDVIGSGGKVVRGIQEETGASIDIQEDGTIHVGAVSGTAMQAAKDMILGIVKEPEVGEVFEGEVVGIKDFGAFVKLTPGKDGLLHISRVANGRVGKVEDVLSLGDIVKVEVLEIDPKTGKISLDRLDKPDAPASASPAPRDKGERHERRAVSYTHLRAPRASGGQPSRPRRPHAASSPRERQQQLALWERVAGRGPFLLQLLQRGATRYSDSLRQSSLCGTRSVRTPRISSTLSRCCFTIAFTLLIESDWCMGGFL